MDSKMDVDLGKLPEPNRLSPATEPASIPTLDGWIENLMSCKQLAENDVQRLCERVCNVCLNWVTLSSEVTTMANGGRSRRLGKFCKMSQTCNPWYVPRGFRPCHIYPY